MRPNKPFNIELLGDDEFELDAALAKSLRDVLYTNIRLGSEPDTFVMASGPFMNGMRYGRGFSCTGRTFKRQDQVRFRPSE